MDSAGMGNTRLPHKAVSFLQEFAEFSLLEGCLSLKGCSVRGTFKKLSRRLTLCFLLSLFLSFLTLEKRSALISIELFAHDVSEKASRRIVLSRPPRISECLLRNGCEISSHAVRDF